MEERGSGERALGAKNYRANGPLPLPIPIWHFRVFFIKNNENQKQASSPDRNIEARKKILVILSWPL